MKSISFSSSLVSTIEEANIGARTGGGDIESEFKSN